MDETEARRRLTEYLPTLQGDIGYQRDPDWLTDTPVFCRRPNGDWLATHPLYPNLGVRIMADGTCVPFFGALGKMVSLLSWQPASREYFLASALHGRYQVYEQGLAVWEEFPGTGDAAYPVAQWPSTEDRARSCMALVAFFDLRKFTEWSANKDPKEVQSTIELFEQAFQNAFSRSWCHQLFSKGTGDGLMVVSEAGNCNQAGATGEGELQPGHCRLFCRACAETVEIAISAIPDALAVGCGVTLGTVTRLYLLGRPDYIGPVVNNASKIQAIAYGELCISTEVVKQLQRDGVEVKGKNIPGKGMRLATTGLANPRGA